MNLLTIDPGKQARINGGADGSHIITVLSGSVLLKSGAKAQPIQAGSAEAFLANDHAIVSNFSDLPAELIEITYQSPSIGMRDGAVVGPPASSLEFQKHA